MGVSKRGIKFGVVALVAQVVFIAAMGLFGDYKKYTAGDMTTYPNFQDVNVMVFVGFGLLMTFLKNYSLSAVGLNLLISALSIQWSAIVIGFIHADILGGDRFEYGLVGMVESCFATATVLISFGAVLGKTSPVQLLVMALFEVLIAQISKYVCVKHLHAVDIGESMYLHMFGAYFGMSVAFVLYNPEVEASEKEGSVYHSDLFAMIGTLFLFMYWPSFNGGFAGDQSQNAVVNTFLSLCACTVVSFAVSGLVDEKGRFDMVHIQNSTLAGGVAVGACANMPMEPHIAMIIGGIAGLLSVLGYKYLTPFLASKCRLHDTCGVHNLHGIPAWVAAIATAILAADASTSDWKKDFSDIFGADPEWDSSEKRGGYQVAAACVTMAFAVVGGLLTGALLKIPIWDAPEDDSIFDDKENWILGEDDLPVVSNAKPTADDTHM